MRVLCAEGARETHFCYDMSSLLDSNEVEHLLLDRSWRLCARYRLAFPLSRV